MKIECTWPTTVEHRKVTTFFVLPLYRWLAVPLSGQTLVGDHHTFSGLLSHQVCSQSSPAKPGHQETYNRKKKRLFYSNKILVIEINYIFTLRSIESVLIYVVLSIQSDTPQFLNIGVVLTLILASSGPLLVSDTLVPCFSLCLYVFITPQRKALLF